MSPQSYALQHTQKKRRRKSLMCNCAKLITLLKRTSALEILRVSFSSVRLYD